VLRRLDAVPVTVPLSFVIQGTLVAHQQGTDSTGASHRDRGSLYPGSLFGAESVAAWAGVDPEMGEGLTTRKQQLRAMDPVRLLVVDPTGYDTLFAPRSMGRIKQLLLQVAQATPLLPMFVQALAALGSGAPERAPLMGGRLQTARLVLVPEATEVLRIGMVASDVSVVISGRLAVGEFQAPDTELGAGALVGLPAASSGAPSKILVTTLEACALLSLPRTALPAARPSQAEGPPRGDEVLVVGVPGLGLPLVGLTVLLACWIERNLGYRVIVGPILPGPPAAMLAQVTAHRLEKRRRQADLLLLVGPPSDDAALDTLVELVPDALMSLLYNHPLQWLTLSTALLAHTIQSPRRILPTVVLSEIGQPSSADGSPPGHGGFQWSRQRQGLGRVATAVQRERDQDAYDIVDGTQAIPTLLAKDAAIGLAWPIDALRVRFGQEVLALAGRLQGPAKQGAPIVPGGLPDRDLADITALWQTAPDRTFGQWGRGVTGTRVGVAVGGGGALAYVGVPLLEGLHRHQVPVDVMAGSSFGAVVSAYYGVEGREGLERVQDDWWKAQVCCMLALLSTRPFAWWINCALGPQDLNELLMPVIPVATDAYTGYEVDIRRGDLGVAVRASGSMPPYAPTVLGNLRLIDGSVSAETPTQVLRDAGCDIVIGVQPFPLPIDLSHYHHIRFPCLYTMYMEASLIRRFGDTFRSYFSLWRQASYSQLRDGDIGYLAETERAWTFSFARAKRIVKQAESSKSLHQSLRLATRRWLDRIGPSGQPPMGLLIEGLGFRDVWRHDPEGSSCETVLEGGCAPIVDDLAASMAADGIARWQVTVSYPPSRGGAAAATRYAAVLVAALTAAGLPAAAVHGQGIDAAPDDTRVAPVVKVVPVAPR
jgi:predicted acylesterase/phospholipase RssA